MLEMEGFALAPLKVEGGVYLHDFPTLSNLINSDETAREEFRCLLALYDGDVEKWKKKVRWYRSRLKGKKTNGK